MKTFDYPWIQETVESIHRKQPTTKELMQAGSRSAEVNAKLDKWIDAKIPPVGAYYMPKWLGKVDIEDSVEYDSLGLPKRPGGYDRDHPSVDALCLPRDPKFGIAYWIDKPVDCLGFYLSQAGIEYRIREIAKIMASSVSIMPIEDDLESIKQAPCGDVVSFNGFPIRCNPTLG